MLSPELQLQSLQLMLSLRDYGADGQQLSEKLRGKLRKAMLGAQPEEAAREVESLIDRYKSKLESVSGAKAERKAAKRRRLEKSTVKTSKYVDDAAESGDETP